MLRNSVNFFLFFFFVFLSDFNGLISCVLCNNTQMLEFAVEERQRLEGSVTAEEMSGEGIMNFIWIWVHLKDNLDGMLYFLKNVSFDKEYTKNKY